MKVTTAGKPARHIRQKRRQLKIDPRQAAWGWGVPPGDRPCLRRREIIKSENIYEQSLCLIGMNIYTPKRIQQRGARKSFFALQRVWVGSGSVSPRKSSRRNRQLECFQIGMAK